MQGLHFNPNQAIMSRYLKKIPHQSFCLFQVQREPLYHEENILVPFVHGDPVTHSGLHHCLCQHSVHLWHLQKRDIQVLWEHSLNCKDKIAPNTLHSGDLNTRPVFFQCDHTQQIMLAEWFARINVDDQHRVLFTMDGHIIKVLTSQQMLNTVGI